MAFDQKVLLLERLPDIVRRPVMAFYHRREAHGRGDPELRQLKAIVPRGATSVDIGAHIGIYTAQLSRLSRRVYAFEPNPLLANFLEGLAFPNVAVHHLALGDKIGTAQLQIPAGGGGLGSLREDFDGDVVESVEVATSRLDALDLGKIDFIKIDVEGFEEQALAGAKGVVERDRPALLIEIEERHNPGGLERIVERLGALDYAGFFLDQGRWRPVGDFDVARHQDLDRLGQPSGSLTRYINNFLFLPSGAQPMTVN